MRILCDECATRTAILRLQTAAAWNWMHDTEMHIAKCTHKYIQTTTATIKSISLLQIQALILIVFMCVMMHFVCFHLFANLNNLILHNFDFFVLTLSNACTESQSLLGVRVSISAFAHTNTHTETSIFHIIGRIFFLWELSFSSHYHTLMFMMRFKSLTLNRFTL